MGLIDDILKFTSRVLYYVDRYSLSLDKAYQYAKHSLKLSSVEKSPKFFYEISRDVVSKFIQLDLLCRRYNIAPTYKNIVRLWLLLYGEDIIRLDAVKHYIKRLKKRFRNLNLSSVIKEVKGVERLAIEYSFPLQFVEKLSSVLPLDEVERLLKSLNSDILWLRVNTLKFDVDRAIKVLEEEGVLVEVDCDFEFMLRVVKYEKPLHKLSIVREGKVIIQDKASAFAVRALDPKPGDVVLDLCAAPGIKTSLIMQLTENRARVIAFDKSRKRLRSMIRLLKLYGVDVSRVHIVLTDSRVIRWIAGVDKVLVDAPCTSSGVVCRDPAVKVHLRRLTKVEHYSQIQVELLRNALRWIPVNTPVIFTTCSLLPDEGEEVVKKVINGGALAEVAPLNLPIATGYPGYPFSSNVRRTFPHVHHCGGFFYCKLVKI